MNPTRILLESYSNLVQVLRKTKPPSDWLRGLKEEKKRGSVISSKSLIIVIYSVYALYLTTLFLMRIGY